MKAGAHRLFNWPVYILLHTSIAQKMNNTKYSFYIQVHMVFSKDTVLLKLIGIKMKKNKPVDLENQQVFGFRKPTTEIKKNKLINIKLCLRCSSPKCLSSITCFSVWYYYTSKLSNFDFTSEKIQTSHKAPSIYVFLLLTLLRWIHKILHAWLWYQITKHKHKILHDNNLIWVQCAIYWFFHTLPVAKQTLHHLHPSTFFRFKFWQLILVITKHSNMSVNHTTNLYSVSTEDISKLHWPKSSYKLFSHTQTLFPFRNKDNTMPHVEGNLQTSDPHNKTYHDVFYMGNNHKNWNSIICPNHLAYWGLLFQ